MKQNSWIKTVLQFAKPCKCQLVLAILLQLISVVGGIVPYIGVYQIIKLFFKGTATMQQVGYWSIICLLGYFVMLLFHSFSTTLSHLSAYRILEAMRMKMANRLMNAPLGSVLNQTIGSLKSIIVDRVETIERPIAHIIPDALPNIILPVCIYIYIITIDWRMALAALITVPIAALSYSFVLKTFGKKYDEYMQANTYVNGVIVEYVEGIEVIKAFNQSTSSYEKFYKAVKSFKNYTLDWYESTWKQMNFGAAVLPSSLLGTLPVGMFLYWKGSLAPADLVMCIILSLGVIEPLTTFTIYVNEMKSIQYAVTEASSLLHMKELNNATTPVKIKKYNIELNNISFAYENLDEKSKQNQVLSDLSLKIPQGTFTALVGPSGGGKSTIARLIARFWDVTKGHITIDGIDIKEIPLEQLSDIVSFVTQDNFLFNCSLLENIRLGNPNASDEEVIRAAKAAYCHEFIQNFDKGYHTTAGEAGGSLSGGERQRIAIARAILKNAPIVILDEATAFTDPENEDKIQKSIAALTKGKTLIVIAHRLSTIKNADKIVVLKKGKIDSKGTHKELLQNSALYKDMWEAHINAKCWAANKTKGVK